MTDSQKQFTEWFENFWKVAGQQPLGISRDELYSLCHDHLTTALGKYTPEDALSFAVLSVERELRTRPGIEFDLIVTDMWDALGEVLGERDRMLQELHNQSKQRVLDVAAGIDTPSRKPRPRKGLSEPMIFEDPRKRNL